LLPLCALVLSLTTVTVLAVTELSTVQPAPSIVLLSKSSQNTAPAGQAPPPSPEPLLPDPVPPSFPPPLPPSPVAMVPLLDPPLLLELPAPLLLPNPLLLPPLDELLDPPTNPLLLPPELLDEPLDPRSLPLLDELLLDPPEEPAPCSNPPSGVGVAAVLLHAGRTKLARPSEIVRP